VAEDLVQETFLAAAKSFDSFKGRSSFYTWLYGIFMNKFRSRLRKMKRRSSIAETAGEAILSSLPDDMPEAHDLIEKEERAGAIREVIDELPLHHKSVITLRYIEGMSYENIADVLDCSLGTVKSRIHYALKKVAVKLKKRPEVGDEGFEERN
jgi:RNA polymerase sigma-70 factor (ECF subfamily)